MIYITGDTHSNFSRFEEDKFPIQKEMTKMIILLFVGTLEGDGLLKKKVV